MQDLTNLMGLQVQKGNVAVSIPFMGAPQVAFMGNDMSLQNLDLPVPDTRQRESRGKQAIRDAFESGIISEEQMNQRLGIALQNLDPIIIEVPTEERNASGKDAVIEAYKAGLIDQERMEQLLQGYPKLQNLAALNFTSVLIDENRTSGKEAVIKAYKDRIINQETYEKLIKGYPKLQNLADNSSQEFWRGVSQRQGVVNQNTRYIKDLTQKREPVSLENLFVETNDYWRGVADRQADLNKNTRYIGDIINREPVQYALQI